MACRLTAAEKCVRGMGGQYKRFDCRTENADHYCPQKNSGNNATGGTLTFKKTKMTVL